jgi:hypothetical protein
MIDTFDEEYDERVQKSRGTVLIKKCHKETGRVDGCEWEDKVSWTQALAGITKDMASQLGGRALEISGVRVNSQKHNGQKQTTRGEKRDPER